MPRPHTGLVVLVSGYRETEFHLVVELERLKEVVERVEVGFLEMVSDDGNSTTVHIASTQQPAIGPHVQHVADTIRLGRWTVTERVI